MNAERYARLREIFFAACDLEADRQEGYLVEACNGDPSLARDLKGLLEADSTSSGALSDDVISEEMRTRFLRALDAAEVQLMPARIGRYNIVRRIGAGGMGVVFEATEESPKRTVALKLLYPSMSGVGDSRRFEIEAQALALLQHPAIATIYEAGTAELDGRTVRYLAMELVTGESIIDHASRHGLIASERLELVARVCDAVHHAHQKGVIHRDLKPSNVVVDESGQPKILDFGVARITRHDICATTARTEAGRIIGTLTYMSPEQARGDSKEIDIRSDVYALGVLCFELLSGRPPYDVQDRLMHETVRMICDDEPTRLSTLDRTFRGDIETIVSKAIAKDKDRRYASASEFAADIRRYLNNEPIIARPASAIYQFKKFARRNRGLVGAAAALFVLLATGVTGLTMVLIRLNDSNKQLVTANAELNEARNVAQAALAKSETARREADVVVAFLGNMFVRVDPRRDGRDLLVRDVLDSAGAAIEKSLAKEPIVEGRVRHILGVCYGQLGYIDKALLHLSLAVDLHQTHLGDDDLRTLQSLSACGLAHEIAGNLAEAESMMLRALNGMTRVKGEDHPDTLNCMNNLAILYNQLGRIDEQIALNEQTLNRRRRVLGPDHHDTLMVLMNLGVAYFDAGRLSDAESCFVEVFDGQLRTLGSKHISTVGTRHNLLRLFLAQGRLDEAAELAKGLIETYDRLLGSHHTDSLLARIEVGNLLRKQGSYDESIALYEQARQLACDQFGSRHPIAIDALHNIAALYSDINDSRAAEIWPDVIEAKLAAFGPTHGKTILAQSAYARFLHQTGRLSDAERILRDAHRKCLLNSQSASLLATVSADLAALLGETNRQREAIELAVGAYDATADDLGATHRQIERLVEVIIRSHEALGETQESERWRSRVDGR